LTNWSTQQRQRKFAAFFGRAHDTDATLQFFIGCADGEIPLWNPNANAIESWHRQLAHLFGVILRASLANCLEATIPAICRDASRQLAATGWLLHPECPPEEMAQVARRRLKRGPPMLCSPDRSVWRVMSRHYSEKHPEATELTPAMQRAYVRSLKGYFADNITKEEAQDVATCMHTVRLDMRYKGGSNPGYRCDCKKFVHIGLCSCVCMVASEVGKLDLDRFCAK
jgi:hypothetical protein